MSCRLRVGRFSMSQCARRRHAASLWLRPWCKQMESSRTLAPAHLLAMPSDALVMMLSKQHEAIKNSFVVAPSQLYHPNHTSIMSWMWMRFGVWHPACCFCIPDLLHFRVELVKWCSEAGCPFNIVNDSALQTLIFSGTNCAGSQPPKLSTMMLKWFSLQHRRL